MVEGNGELMRTYSLVPQDARMVRRAIRGGWVNDVQGEKAARTCEDILNDPDASLRNKIAAARTLAALASVDVRRESNHTRERGQDSQAATATLRAFLATPEGAALLSTLSPALLADQGQTPPSPEDPVQPSIPVPPSSCSGE